MSAPDTMTLAEYREAWTEDQLGTWLLNTARSRGWLACHFRPAKTAKGWRTPLQGDDGFPDWVLARNGRVIFAELKRAPKFKPSKLTPGQRAWDKALTGETGATESVIYLCIDPRQCDAIEAYLTWEPKP